MLADPDMITESLSRPALSQEKPLVGPKDLKGVSIDLEPLNAESPGLDADSSTPCPTVQALFNISDGSPR